MTRSVAQLSNDTITQTNHRRITGESDTPFPGISEMDQRDQRIGPLFARDRNNKHRLLQRTIRTEVVPEEVSDRLYSRLRASECSGCRWPGMHAAIHFALLVQLYRNCEILCTRSTPLKMYLLQYSNTRYCKCPSVQSTVVRNMHRNLEPFAATIKIFVAQGMIPHRLYARTTVWPFTGARLECAFTGVRIYLFPPYILQVTADLIFVDKGLSTVLVLTTIASFITLYDYEYHSAIDTRHAMSLRALSLFNRIRPMGVNRPGGIATSPSSGLMSINTPASSWSGWGNSGTMQTRAFASKKVRRVRIHGGLGSVRGLVWSRCWLQHFLTLTPTPGTPNLTQWTIPH
jgi:hypothetical protein